MKKKAIEIIGALLLCLAVLFWRSFNNPTIWEWLASFSLLAIILHLGYGAYHMFKRWPRRLSSEYMLDILILLSLIGAIYTIPKLFVSNGFVAFFYYFIAVRYYGLINRSSGLKKRYATRKYQIEVPLVPIFAMASIMGFLFPQGFGNMIQSILQFIVFVLGSIWLIFLSDTYKI